MDLVRSRVHRVLSHLERYVDLSGVDAEAISPPVDALESDEVLLGAYRNSAEAETWLLFTTHGGPLLRSPEPATAAKEEVRARAG
jgi:hypothetical protein